jgi:hypothetical protein
MKLAEHYDPKVNTPHCKLVYALDWSALFFSINLQEDPGVLAQTRPITLMPSHGLAGLFFSGC